MALKKLSQFNEFSLDKFLFGKQLTFVRADQWDDKDDDGNVIKIHGTKVLVQITEDKTEYFGDDVEGEDNFGLQFWVKVRDRVPGAYQKLKPMNTEVVITNIERVSVWGKFKNELSIIAVIEVKGTGNETQKQ